MDLNIIKAVVSAYDIKANAFGFSPVESGHIHQTYRLDYRTSGNPRWVLQKLNKVVFKQPLCIMENWKYANDKLAVTGEGYLLVRFKLTKTGQSLYEDKEGHFWRMMPFVENSMGYESFQNTVQVYHAAHAYGKLSMLLSTGGVKGFQACLPEFHNVYIRHEQYQTAKTKAETLPLHKAAGLIEKADRYSWIVEQYNTILKDDALQKLVVHGDCKPSNVLFEKDSDRVLAIADPDTLMPGYFFYDLGDMVRSMICAAPEDEYDPLKVVFREDYFRAILDGYLEATSKHLNHNEKNLLIFAGQYMIYMQGLRFLTDYLNGNIYYPVKYEEHNLIRTRNQFILLDYLYANQLHLHQRLKSDLWL